MKITAKIVSSLFFALIYTFPVNALDTTSQISDEQAHEIVLNGTTVS